jgi:hypothetical protein
VAAAAQGRYVQQPVEWGANWAAVGGKVEVDTIGRLDVLNEAGRAAKGNVMRGLWTGGLGGLFVLGSGGAGICPAHVCGACLRFVLVCVCCVCARVFRVRWFACQRMCQRMCDSRTKKRSSSRQSVIPLEMQSGRLLLAVTPRPV